MKSTSFVSCLLFVIIALSAGQTVGTNSVFRDQETSLGNVMQAGVWLPPADPFDIVLNEFLPNPDTTANGLNMGDDNDSNPLGEWVELYNNNDVAQDLAGWYLEDASGGGGNTQAVISGSNTNTGGTTISAHGWLVVYMNKTTLNNTGDEIHLFTVDNVEVDFVSYNDPSHACVLDPTPGEENSTSTPTGTPGNGPNADCAENQVAPNKSYARIPDGTGAWVDPIPTPGAPNVADERPQSETPAPSAAGGGAPVQEEFVVEISEPVVETTITKESPVTEEETPIVEEGPVVEISEPIVEINAELPPEETPAVEEVVEETPPAEEPESTPEPPLAPTTPPSAQ